MSRIYKLTCQVPEEKFHPLVKYLEALGVVGFSVNMLPAEPPAPRATPTPALVEKPADLPATQQARSHVQSRTFHYVGGRKNKGISARDLVVQILNTSPNPVVSCHDLRMEFVKHGFSKTSISSPLSELTADRKIIRVGEAQYSLSTRHVLANGAAGAPQSTLPLRGN